MLIKLQDANESEASRMLNLKRALRALVARHRDFMAAREKFVEAKFKAIAEDAKNRPPGPPPPSCDPFRDLWPAPPPPPCDPPTVAGPAGKKKRKKVVKRKVPQEHIDHMILSQRDPYNDRYPLERLGKRIQRFREVEAERRALDDKIFEYEQAIIKQFRQKGYAEDYSEVEVDDDAKEDDAEEI